MMVFFCCFFLWILFLFCFVVVFLSPSFALTPKYSSAHRGREYVTEERENRGLNAHRFTDALPHSWASCQEMAGCKHPPHLSTPGITSFSWTSPSPSLSLEFAPSLGFLYSRNADSWGHQSCQRQLGKEISYDKFPSIWPEAKE